MSNLLVYTPQYKLEFQKNYDGFIAFARDELTMFSDSESYGKKGWECDRWSWMTAREKKMTIVFGISHSRSRYTPYRVPYADFAKAYVRYELSLNYKESLGWTSALPFLYQALAEHSESKNKSTVDVMEINNNIINRTEQLIKTSNLSVGGKRNIGLSLQKVLAFIKKMRLKLDIQDWKNPFPRPSDSKIKLDKRSREVEMDKCPSDYQMLQVAEAFNRAETPRQKYFTSLCVMLICQPSRSVELNGLTIHSLQRSDKGRWYLMWHPAKGGAPVRKWIPKLLEDVARQAFERLVEISAPARAAAKFAYDYPDNFMVHDKCITPQNFSQDRVLTFEQFGAAMGFTTGFSSKGSKLGWGHQTSSKWLNDLISRLNGVSNWRRELLKGHHIQADNQVLKKVIRVKELVPVDVKIIFPNYHDLNKIVHEKYKNKVFPYYGHTKVWDCICLVRENEFHKEYKVKPFSWVHVSHGMIANALGSYRETHHPSGSTTNAISIFEDLNITDEDGSRLKLTTHQFRHWLNTKLMLS
ncbi:hypothetical protein, partial [Idiomarina baltica]|uniref:hypothetical protein n=1 Tax=Idiomarina baltica TaxID=190892 RepID=UPI002FDEC731